MTLTCHNISQCRSFWATNNDILHRFAAAGVSDLRLPPGFVCKGTW